MSMIEVQPPYPAFAGADGQPLENGYIWIGTVNLSPQVNPIAVYWDAANTIAAPQPIRTLNGYPSPRLMGGLLRMPHYRQSRCRCSGSGTRR